MKTIITVALILVAMTTSAMAGGLYGQGNSGYYGDGGSGYYGDKQNAPNYNYGDKPVHVNPYTRGDGTTVREHHRQLPNNSPYRYNPYK